MKFKKKILATVVAAIMSSAALADQVLIIDASYGSVTNNVKSRLEAAGHTVTITTNTSNVPTGTGTYQQVWDLRYAAALSASEVTNYTQFITAGGFAYFVTENPGCCMARNNSVAQLVTGLGGGSTQIGPGWAANVNSNMNTTYMTQGITVNYLAVAAIVNNQGIPLIRDANNNVSGMSWIGRAGALGSGVTGTIVTVADVNWLSEAWGTQNQQALDDIITGIVAGTVGGTISAQGNGAAASNGAAQQQQQNPPPPPPPPAPTTFSQTNANQVVVSDTMASGTFTGNGGALQAAAGATTISNDVVLNASGMIFDNNGQEISLTGAMSGAGGITYTNTGNGGSTTLNGIYTYTGPTIINNSATVINNSNISSSSLLTNLGRFTNSATGRTGNWINGFNGDGNTAVLNNAGTMGNGTNYSTFNNNGGTVGTVTNVGTFNNAGNTGAVSNMGVFNNNAGGTVSQLAYNNHWVVNNGTINTVTYNGGTVNNNGTIGSIDNSEAHGNFNNAGTVSGTVTTNSTFNNSGTVVGLFTNSGALTNTGTTGDWINNATINNSGTMGNGTNNAGATFTNNSGATVGNTINNGTFTNAGTVGSITTGGVFDNAGTAGAVTLTGGTFSNTGTAASVDNTVGLTFTNGGTITGVLTNAGDVSNTGNIGSVTNTGTYANSGTTGDWNNSNTISNTGTMGNGTNNANATFTNSGTVGTVDNRGTFTNSGTTNTVTNSGWFTNAVNAVVGFFTNTGTASNAGTTGDWNNSSTLTNSGTMGNGTNSGTYTNSGTVGNVANSGTYTNSGNAGTVTNTGTLNYNGGTLGGYNQSGNGITVMFAGTPVTVSGAAALGGGLVVNNAPTAYGRYTVLNANNVSGAYDSLTSAGANDYLKYSGTDVKLYVTPPAGATQSSIDTVGKNFANALNLQTSAVTAGLGNDCATFGDKGGCVSVNVGQSKAGTGDLNSGGVTVSKAIDGNWRAGVFGTGAFNNTQNGNVEGKSNPATGGFVTWTSGPYSVQASAATNTGELKVTRNGPEVGVGSSSVKNTAYQLRGTYTLPIDEKTSVTPYVGVRQVDTQIGGYTETGPVFPLTVDPISRKTTSVIAGATLARKLSDKLTGSVSAGVVQQISERDSGYRGSSEIGGMSTFNSVVPNNGRTNGSFGAALSYKVNDSTSVAVNAGLQQKGSNANVSSFGVTLTKGF